jgi:periplasmic divalent cation tolerance protein
MVKLGSNTGSKNYGVVLVTVASSEEGEAIARSLIEAKLAGCVNMFPLSSMYLWQGKIQRDQEYQLLIKTDLGKFNELRERVTVLHSYEVPEIIAIPIMIGSDSYLKWLGECLN